MLMKFIEILVSQGASQGGSSSARSFDLAHPGVAPPLRAACDMRPSASQILHVVFGFLFS